MFSKLDRIDWFNHESIGLIMNQELNQFDPLKKTEGSKKGAKTVPTGNLTTKTDSNFGF
jgi:hypothetical protein